MNNNCIPDTQDVNINTSINIIQPTNYIHTNISEFYPQQILVQQSGQNNNIPLTNNDTFNTPLQTNQQYNNKDNIAYGDSIEKKQNNTIRFYYQNLHGIKKANTWHDLQHSIPTLQEWDVDIMGYSETNIQWKPHDKQCIQTQYTLVPIHYHFKAL